MKSEEDKNKSKSKRKNVKNGTSAVFKHVDQKWVIKIIILTILISISFTLLSQVSLKNAGYVLAFAVLAIFIFIGIAFDMLGIAVTSADVRPFHSMAAHKEVGATEALWLIKNAEKVSSVCNDVVGDISGIVSSSMAAIIASKISGDFSASNIVLQLIISAVVAGIMIGGKAAGKGFAFNFSTDIIHFSAKLLHLFFSAAGRLSGKA